jgi:adenylyl cyclase-associated protein
MSVEKMEAIAKRLEAVAAKLETLSLGGGAAAGGDDNNDFEGYPQIVAYDKFVNPNLEIMKKAAAAIDPELVEMTGLVERCYLELRRYILTAARCKQPAEADAANVSKPLTDAMADGTKWCDTHFKTKFPDHEKAVHEVMACFQWAFIGPSAEAYITEMIGSVQCYTNKVIRNFRDTDKNHVEWQKGLVAGLKAFPEYINDFHKMGISWAKNGKPATAPTTMKGAQDAPKPAEAPKPAAAAPAKPAPGKLGGIGGKLNLQPKVAPKTASISRAGPSMVRVEYFEGKNPELTDLKLQDIVNFFACKNCTLTVPTKVKAVSLLNCEKVQVVLGDVVGMVEVTGLKRSDIRMTGTVKSMTIDKCDSVCVYVNEESINLQAVCAMSTGINIEVPDLKDEGGIVEFSVPEQIQIQLKDRKLTHTVYVHE